jgi:hypothetical protein
MSEQGSQNCYQTQNGRHRFDRKSGIDQNLSFKFTVFLVCWLVWLFCTGILLAKKNEKPIISLEGGKKI